jgi:putative FmdB family regulatory protein
MPIYEFHCGKCEKDSEILVRSNRWQGTKCPHCGSTKLAKRLSVFASSGGGGAEPGPACSPNGPRSCGCHCAGGKHKH